MRIQRPSDRVLRYAERDTVLPCGGGKDGQSPNLVKTQERDVVRFQRMVYRP